MASAGKDGVGPVRVRLAAAGLRLEDEVLPLYAGAVHYWRLAPADWRACLRALRELGLGLVDLYVPWSIHELAPGELDLGQTDPRCDVVRFLQLAHELGLRAIVRPGPHINAELTHFGLPERVLWDPACQALSPQLHPVMLPVPPRGFPVPSHASHRYLDEARRYLTLMSRQLAPLRYPDGPIVLAQVDNEGAMFFRDGAYDQDYHPDAIDRYRRFLQDAYGTVAELRGAYGDGALGDDTSAPGSGDFATVEPPTHFDASHVSGLRRHLDWVRFQEELIVEAFATFAEALRDGGLATIPTTHNLPMAHEITALNPARLSTAVDLLGLDFYGGATERERATIARRVTELSSRCAARDLPPFACEMGAGYPPYFPPLSPDDSAFTVLTALAYGLRGFNVFMAVERDRWIGAPVDPQGRPRPFADFWRRLSEALRATEFHQLRRCTPVCLVTPRTERRLARVLHAFGPASPAMLAVLGANVRDGSLESDLGLGYPLVVDADELAQRVADALDRHGVPFAWVAGEDAGVALADAEWVICATSGGLSRKLRSSLGQVLDRGARVTVGPHEPRFDDAMRPLAESEAERWGDRVELLRSTEQRRVDQWVVAAATELGLPRYHFEPGHVRVTVHQDRRGQARVVFAINPSDREARVRLQLGERVAGRACMDLLGGAPVRSQAGTIELSLASKSVAMLGLQ